MVGHSRVTDVCVTFRNLRMSVPNLDTIDDCPYFKAWMLRRPHSKFIHDIFLQLPKVHITSFLFGMVLRNRDVDY